MSATYESGVGLVSTLQCAGFMPRTPWWSGAWAAVHAHPGRRAVFEIGRGGIKSTSMVDEAINQTLFGDWVIPPGEVHFFAWVSQNKSEAGQRIRQIAARLRELKIPFDQAGDELILRDMPRGIRVFACQVGSVSGFRCFGFCADEVAKWTNAADSANPAPEVVASIRAMTVTHPGAREYFISSPLGKFGLHYELVQAGTNGEQIVFAGVPTWVANPSVTEEQTRKLEPDPRIWAREYAAIAQDAALAAFPADAVTRAFVPRDPAFAPASKVMVLDPSSGGLTTRDRFTWAIASWCVDEFQGEKYRYNSDGQIRRWPHGLEFKTPEFFRWKERGAPYLALHEIGAFEGGFAGKLTGEQIAEELAKIAKRHDVRSIESDQRESLFLSSALSRHGYSQSKFHAHTWTASSKPAAVTLVRRWLADGLLALPPDAMELRRELLSFEEVINASGALTYGARGHDDFVALLLTLAHAELNQETRLPRSNIKPRFWYGRAQ